MKEKIEWRSQEAEAELVSLTAEEQERTCSRHRSKIPLEEFDLQLEKLYSKAAHLCRAPARLWRLVREVRARVAA